MKYLIMLGNEEYLTKLNLSNKEVQSSTDRLEAMRFSNQSEAIDKLNEVRELFTDADGIRIVLDV